MIRIISGREAVDEYNKLQAAKTVITSLHITYRAIQNAGPLP